MNRVAVLTPPGNAAIAVIAVSGPSAWATLRTLFRIRGSRVLPETAEGSRFWFGTFGETVSDEVILTRKNSEDFEIHCHGGQRVVGWIASLLRSRGFERIEWNEIAMPFADPAAAALLPFTKTVRTASILLDQAHGAWLRAQADPKAHHEALMRNQRVGRHLVEPWRIAIAGVPNAGKSTLMNALAGFARSVVSPTPGTTRDAVTVSLAFDGWPVELVDTAGLRNAPDELEEEGVARARQVIAESDLCLWVVDATAPVQRPDFISIETLDVWNKCDLSPPGDTNAVGIAAAAGRGLPELIERIAKTLVPDPPRPGEPVPYLNSFADRM